MLELHDICTFIKLNRLVQNISVDYISKELNMSKSQYSKIERGLSKAKESTYKEIVSFLDLDYLSMNSSISDAKLHFDSIYTKIIYCIDKQEVKTELNEWNEKGKEEFITVELLLINLIYNVTNICNFDITKKIIKLLYDIHDLMTGYQKQLLYQYEGLYQLDTTKTLDLAIQRLEKALNVNYDEVTYSMIYYHLGQIYKNNKQLLKGFRSMMIAKDFFTKTNNFVRSIMTDVSIANFYSLNCEYEEALKLYLQCIENYKKVNMSIYSRATSYYNITLVLNFMERYEETLKFIEDMPIEILDYISPIHDFILNKIIALYGVGREKEALELCNSLKSKLNKDSVIDNFILYYYNVNNKNQRLRCLDRIRTIIKTSKDYSWCRLLFILYKKEATTIKHFEELTDFYHKYIFNNV